MQRFIPLRLLIVGLFALFCNLPAGFAQLSKHGNIWHFGFRAGLDFTSGVPVKITNSAMDAYEGCSSYCDASGQLLFYSNGGGSLSSPVNGTRNGYIWNRNNEVMFDMDQTMGGGYSAAQSGVVLPKPGSPNHYYQFTMDQVDNLLVPNRGLSYFEVDMTLNGGLGSVTTASVPVYKPASESLTATVHANGQGFWVITLDKGTKAFVVVPVTASGVGQPQVQNVQASAVAQVLKMSPDGRFLCAGGRLYSFNAADGTLAFVRMVAISSYTLSFSPDSRYLYGFDSDNTIVDVIQYDLLSPDLTSLKVSQSPSFTFGGLMQIAPDGNIYFIEQLPEDFEGGAPTVSLSVIRCPNSNAPQLEQAILKFPTDVDNGGVFTSLPNFADYIFATNTATQDTVQKDICLNPIVLQPNQPGLHYQWSTSDTTSQIMVSQTGTYSVAVEDACGTTRTTVFQVQPGGAEVNITFDAIRDSCRAFPLTLRAESDQAGTFLWSGGSTGDSLVITEFGTYTVQLLTACGTAADTFHLLKPQEDCCRPMFPNAFTPNGDNINDRFSAILDQCDIEILDFFIYDRWGELVFQTYKPSEQWDGTTLNGTQSQSDMYSYTLRYKRRGQTQEQFEKGQVTLLR